MIIIERNRVRKIFYSSYILIMLLLIISMTFLFTSSLKTEYQIKVKQLKESLISFKKSYIKDNVGVVIQAIEIESESQKKELANRVEIVSKSILECLNSKPNRSSSDIFSLLNRIPLQTEYVVFDLLKNKIISTNRKNHRYSKAGSPEEIINIVRSSPVHRIKKDNSNRYLICTSVSKEKIESLVQKKIKDRIKKTKLLSSGYLWVNKIINYDGGDDYAIRLIHPNLPETEGKRLSTHSTDIKGNFPYKEELEGVKKEGEVFFEYYFKKMNSNTIAHKLSYARLYKPYDWVIATGVYLDDIQTLLQNEEKRMLKTYHYRILLSGILSLVCIFLSGLIMFYFEAHLYRLIKKFGETIKDREESLKSEKQNAVKAFEKAEENEKKYRYLFHNMREAFTVCEVVFDEQNTPIDFIYKDVNKGFETEMGLGPDEVTGKKLSEVFPDAEKDTASWLSIFGEVVKTGQNVTLESFSEALNKWYYVNAFKINGNDFAFIFMDITPLKEKEKMSGVLELSGAVCHELSQPLQSITGFSELLLMDVDETDPKYSKLTKLSSEIIRLGEIVQRLSRITKYETIEFSQGRIIDINKSSLS